MGYHIINRTDNEDGTSLSHHYAETLDELASFDFIKKDSIIFEGSGNISPEIVGHSNSFRRFSQPWYRAGIKAENLFEEQAKSHNMMVERINQDKKSFKNYYNSRDKYIPLKRGDFIIRDHGNIEIDVKCRSFKYFDNEKHFRFNVEHMFRHLNMATLLHSPVLIAVYERDESGERPLADNIYFLDVKKMYEHRKSFYKDVKEYYEVEYFYNIPLSLAEKGFGYIRQLSEAIMEGNYEYQTQIKSEEQINNACLSKHNTNWTVRDFNKLKNLYKNGHSVKEIADEMDRSKKAVEFKIDRME